MRCRWCGMETENSQMCDWCRRNPLGEAPEITLARERALALQQRQQEVVHALSRIEDILDNAEDERNINAIINETSLTEHELAPVLNRLQRAFLIRDIATGNLPSLSAPDIIILRPTEICHWYAEAVLFEIREEVKYKGSLLGGSFHIGGGFFLNLGDIGGRLESSQDIAPVGEGVLIITSKRLIFFAPALLLEFGLHEVVSFQYAENILVVHISGRALPLLLVVADGELAGRILHRACQNVS